MRHGLADQLVHQIRTVQAIVEREQWNDVVLVGTVRTVVVETGDIGRRPVGAGSVDEAVVVHDLLRLRVALRGEGDLEVALRRVVRPWKRAVVGVDARNEQHVVVVRDVLHHDRMPRSHLAIEARQHERVVREAASVPGNEILQHAGPRRTPVLRNLLECIEDVTRVLGEHDVVVAVRLDPRHSGTATPEAWYVDQLQKPSSEVLHEVAGPLGATNHLQLVAGEVQQHAVGQAALVLGVVLVAANVQRPWVGGVQRCIGEGTCASEFGRSRGDTHDGPSWGSGISCRLNEHISVGTTEYYNTVTGIKQCIYQITSFVLRFKKGLLWESPFVLGEWWLNGMTAGHQHVVYK
jgi:hypothetical protein